MFNTSYNKTLISVVMGLLILLDQWFGISFGFVTEEWLTMLLTVVWAVLVWRVPNAEEPSGQ